MRRQEAELELTDENEEVLCGRNGDGQHVLEGLELQPD